MSELFPKKRLPAEYDEVEYLEFTGSQYIDTGFKPNNNTKVETIVWEEKNLTKQTRYSAKIDYHKGQFSFHTDNAGYTYVGFGSKLDAANLPSFGSYVTIEHSKDGFYLNGQLHKSIPPDTVFSSTSTLLIGKETTYSYPYAGRIKNYFRIFENNVLVRNFIPCYRKSDNKPGMYDLVSGQFFVNQGTGDDFLYGPIVPYPEEISLGGKEVACIKAPILPHEYQQVEYLDDHGGQQYIEVEPTDSFIPCYRKSDHKPGMYDLANSRKNLFNKDEGVSGIGHVKPNTQYTFSFTKEAAVRTTIIEVLRDGSEVQIWTESSSGELGPKAITFTTSANTDYIRTNSKGFPNAQLEEGSAATAYEPYPFYVNQGTGEFSVGDDIPMYGRWNQYVPSSWYQIPGDYITKGITISKTKEGTYILNGTSTAQIDVNIYQSNKAKKGHKYLWGGIQTSENLTWWLRETGGGFINSRTTGRYIIASSNSSSGYTLVRLFIPTAGTIINNVIITHHIIDLTDIFGAGNEPSTAEEFESWCSARGIDLNEYQPYYPGPMRVFKDYPDGQKVWEKEEE